MIMNNFQINVSFQMQIEVHYEYFQLFLNMYLRTQQQENYMELNFINKSLIILEKFSNTFYQRIIKIIVIK